MMPLSHFIKLNNYGNKRGVFRSDICHFAAHLSRGVIRLDMDAYGFGHYARRGDLASAQQQGALDTIHWMNQCQDYLANKFGMSDLVKKLIKLERGR